MVRTFLVIDIQNEYFIGGALPLWQAEATEALIVSAINKARTKGDKVLLVQHVSKTPSGLFAANSHGVAIRPAILAAAQDAPVVTKAYADAFQETKLAKHLETTSDLLVCGMMTQNCVAFTAMSRAADGYRTQVVSDLCTAPSEIVHRIALNALGSKLNLIRAKEAWADLPPLCQTGG